MKPFCDMPFEEQVEWGAGVILQRLIAGELKAGVTLVMQQCFQLAYEQGQQSVTSKQPDYYVPDNALVDECDISVRSINILKSEKLHTAKQVRAFIKKHGTVELRKIPYCGRKTASEIVDYFLYDMNNE